MITLFTVLFILLCLVVGLYIEYMKFKKKATYSIVKNKEKVPPTVAQSLLRKRMKKKS